MFYNDTLDLHDSYNSPDSRPDILGDGFLLQFNPVYRNVHDFSLKIGCQYVEAYPEYLLMPFCELPNIVAHKKVPYVPSARLMRKVEQNYPGVFTTEDMPLPESYHLHEAAHVIAEHFLKPLNEATPQEMILKAMLAESFANTVDALACTHAADEIHAFFIKQNCYMHPQEKVMHAMNRLIEAMGFRFVFMLTFFTYVHANFLKGPLSKKAILELAKAHAPKTKVNTKLQKDIQTVCAIGEKLDPLFRVTTTGNYLKQQGFEGDLHDLLDFPFMKLFASQPAFKDATEALSDSIA